MLQHFQNIHKDLFVIIQCNIHDSTFLVYFHGNAKVKHTEIECFNRNHITRVIYLAGSIAWFLATYYGST